MFSRFFLFFLLYISLLQAQSWKPIEGKIMSKWSKTITPENVWQEYPRPQFERTQWKNLNGLWDFTVSKVNQIQPKQYKGKILVPFSFESPLSGLGKSINPKDKMWYRKSFKLPNKWSGDDVIIHFEAVDYHSTMWVNDILVGTHKGGFDRFSFNITPYLNPEGLQKIVLSVEDASNFSSQPRGKQQINASGIYYTPVSGIWQTVWLEAVSSEAYLKQVRITSDIDNSKVNLIPMSNVPLIRGYQVAVDVFLDEKKVASGKTKPDTPLQLKIENAQLWSPDHPHLYDVKMNLINPSGIVIDRVESYFGMRKIHSQKASFRSS